MHYVDDTYAIAIRDKYMVIVKVIGFKERELKSYAFSGGFEVIPYVVSHGRIVSIENIFDCSIECIICKAHEIKDLVKCIIQQQIIDKIDTQTTDVYDLPDTILDKSKVSIDVIIEY